MVIWSESVKEPDFYAYITMWSETDVILQYIESNDWHEGSQSVEPSIIRFSGKPNRTTTH